MQIVENIPGVDKREAVIRTIIRDVRSEAMRGSDVTRGHQVKNNSIHKRIFIDGEDVVSIGDLRAAMGRGEFATSSTTWQKYYNAVLVAAIPPMQRATMPRATLCIDNMAGRLDNLFCERLAKELVWRLAVKLYRLDELEKFVDAGRHDVIPHTA